MRVESLDKYSELQGEIDRLSSYIARENLVFLGIPEPNGNEQVQETLRKFYVEKLKLPADFVKNVIYQRVHRCPSNAKPRPIKARFLKYSDKERLRENAKNLKGSNSIFLSLCYMTKNLLDIQHLSKLVTMVMCENAEFTLNTILILTHSSLAKILFELYTKAFLECTETKILTH